MEDKILNEDKGLVNIPVGKNKLGLFNFMKSIFASSKTNKLYDNNIWYENEIQYIERSHKDDSEW